MYWIDEPKLIESISVLDLNLRSNNLKFFNVEFISSNQSITIECWFNPTLIYLSTIKDNEYSASNWRTNFEIEYSSFWEDSHMWISTKAFYLDTKWSGNITKTQNWFTLTNNWINATSWNSFFVKWIAI